jgi:transcriptional regulator
MYVPEPFNVSDREAVLDLIDAHPFATLITFDVEEPIVSHVPVTLARPALRPDRVDREWGVLRGHVARANPHWRCFDGERETLVIFHGPHAFVSPIAYDEPDAPPTWNYAVVHAYGRPKRIEDPETTTAMLDELIARFEPKPGELTLSGDRRLALEKGIVGFDLEIERLEAKFKLGQNKTAADRAGTIAALESRGSDTERDLAAWTRRITGEG